MPEYQSGLVFRRRVRDVMAQPLPEMSRDGDCREALRLLRVHGQKGVLVLSPQRRVVGMVTGDDVIGKYPLRTASGVPVVSVMTSPVHFARQDDYLFQSIAVMRRHAMKCLPVLDDDGGLVGTVHLEQALTASLGPYLGLMEGLTPAVDEKDFGAVRKAQITAAQTLLREGCPAAGVQTLLSRGNDELYHRIVLRVTEVLEEEGWGTPPVSFDVIVMGSGGRGESFLFPDQDNGLILDEYPDERHTPVDAYFIELARRLTGALDSAGIPYCRGAVMATNPLWRKRLDQWQRQLDYWLRRPNTATLRLADIFFDFQPVHGEGRLAAALRRRVTQQVPRHHGFLQMTERVQESHGVALGPFKRLSPDGDAGVQSGRLNLKYHGLLPLVEAIRLLALREGVDCTATLGRIQVLHEKGVLDGDEREYLCAAFHHLSWLVLRQQLKDYAARLPVGAFVPPESLSRRERALLVEGLRAISRLRARVHSEFTGAI